MTSPASPWIETAHRLQRWVRQRPRLVDVGVVMLAAMMGLAELANEDIFASRDADLLAVLLVAAAALILFWRRPRPILALALIMAFISVSYLRGYGTYHAPIGLAAFYSVVAHAENRRWAWTAVATAVLGLFILGSFTLFNSQDGYRFGDAISMLLWSGGVAVAGAVVRNRHEIFLGTEARAAQAEAEVETRARLAVVEERTRIAREMHDIVAHGMSVISVQASAAQEIARSDPGHTIRILEDIEATGREALAEMRRMLGVLRGGDQRSGALSPQPSLTDLSSVIAHRVEAGLPTEFVITGLEQPFSPGLELAAFRIVQEALTNVAKHAGDSATATVALHYGPKKLTVTITDTGRGSVSKLSATGSGNGLIGMRERVDAYDGRLTVGPKPDGGYQVHVVFPIDKHAIRLDKTSTDEPLREQLL